MALIRRMRIVDKSEEELAMATSLKIAFCTDDMKTVNQHFGSAKTFATYVVDLEQSTLLEVAEFGKLDQDGNEDKLAPKIEAIKDCAILYVAAIGGSAAARVVANKVHPIKVSEPESITVLLGKLQDVLKGAPPPWLRKAMLKGSERELNFEEE